MTQTEHEITFITGVHSVFLNRPLQEAMQQNLEYVGGPSFSKSDQQFAKAMQQTLGIEQVGYREKITPLGEGPEPLSGGSTDVAEVSRICPTVQVRVTSAAKGIPWHSWAATACHGREGAIESPAIAAQVLAMSGIEMMTNPELLEKANQYFEQNLEEPYESPLPDSAEPPVPEAMADSAAGQ